MKSLVLSAMICAAAAGNQGANALPVKKIEVRHDREKAGDRQRVDMFKQVIAFHQRNVDVLWQQYTLSEARIRESSGSHADLERDKVFFQSVYEKDIEKGIRVEESKRIIADLEESYAKKHAQRNAYERQHMERLQAQLRTALKKEQKGFEKSKKKYADLVNEETLPLLEAAEQHLAGAIARANNFSVLDTTIAAK